MESLVENVQRSDVTGSAKALEEAWRVNPDHVKVLDALEPLTPG